MDFSDLHIKQYHMKLNINYIRVSCFAEKSYGCFMYFFLLTSLKNLSMSTFNT